MWLRQRGGLIEGGGSCWLHDDGGKMVSSVSLDRDWFLQIRVNDKQDDDYDDDVGKSWQNLCNN